MKNFIRQIFAGCFFLISGSVYGQEPAPPDAKEVPRANIVIVNATTAPTISMKIGGQEMYADFRTGEKTSGGSFEKLETQYEITDNESKVSYGEMVKLVPKSYQSLILMGDFKDIEVGATGIRGLNEGKEPYKNVAFLQLSHDLLGKEKAYRYRFVNAISGKPVVCKNKDEQPVTIESGQAHTYSGKSLQIDFEISEGKNILPLKIRQEPPVHNVTFVIYEKEGILKYVVIPEENAETLILREGGKS